jgi:hypothetical protein
LALGNHDEITINSYRENLPLSIVTVFVRFCRAVSSAGGS